MERIRAELRQRDEQDVNRSKEIKDLMEEYFDSKLVK
jgi:hypothetical protein